MPFCTQCGKPVNPTAKFCGECGEPYSASQPPLAPTNRQESVPENKTLDAARTANCPVCQETHHANGKCVGCGNRVTEPKYCPVCRGVQTFTIDKSGRELCWNSKQHNNASQVTDMSDIKAKMEEMTKMFQGAGAGKYMQQADVAAVLQQGQRPPLAQKPCPTCKRPIDYIPQFQKYYCSKCKKYS